jgi:hypothetical protein
MFRCLTREQLEKHLTGYKRHVMMANTPGIGDQRRYLVANPSPRKITEGVDYRLANLEDQVGQQFKHVDPFEESPTQSLSVPKSQDLITVRVTPDVLATLTSSMTPKAPSTVTKVGVTASTSELPRYDPLRPGLHDFDDLSDLLSMPTSRQPHTQISSSVYVPTPQSSSLSVAKRTPLHTPVLHNDEDDLHTHVQHQANREENVLDQILGTSTPMTFSPVGAASVTEAENPMIRTTREQATQTKTHQEELAQKYQPLTATIGHLENTLQVSLGKVTFAMDSNTRATRHLGQTLESMAESLKTLSRSMERYVEDTRRHRRDESSTRSEKRPRTEDKENSPTLKSVVNKKKNNRN